MWGNFFGEISRIYREF